MKKYLLATIVIAITCCSFKIISTNLYHAKQAIILPVQKKQAAKIQVAILLDVSNSMDGLIEQAKAQLWNMVSVMGKATCDNLPPDIEIALFEYGRSDNSVQDGYVKKLSGFTKDLDNLSKTLFKLSTNGGEEYCGQVMYTSLKNLDWDSASGNYKVIFIAGNEDFLQGKVGYTKACKEAKQKGVIINTIYCGDKYAGIQEHWNIIGECGGGSYTNINQDAKIIEIPTPYDDQLFSLNEKLNGTYMAYGYQGQGNLSIQADVDNMNYAMSKSVAAERIAVKGKKNLYKNDKWDMVDALNNDSSFINKVDLKTLPDSLQKKSRVELKQMVTEKNKERAAIQKEIEVLSEKRKTYIAKEKAGNSKSATLETEIEKIIKKQAKLFNMIIQ